MVEGLERLSTFLAELRRRHVYKVAAVYLVLAAAGLELVSVVVPASRLPEWSDALLLALAVAGFPIAIVLAWTFDLTEEGLRRTGPTPAAPGPDTEAAEPHTSADASAPPDDAATFDRRTVAVLPFENLSGTADAGPFAAGLHDDLLTELSRVSALTVISRTSVMRYRGSGLGVREISRELRAGTVVEGGVQRVGNRVRLNVQLIDARTDTHGWAERYDRELTASDIFDIQTELASRIAATVEAELTSAERDRVTHQPTQDLEAYRLYALGRETFASRTEPRMREAIDYFEAALERDPGYALAWAGLGLAITQLADYGHSNPDVELPRAEAACERALEIDPDLAEAFAVRGCVHIAAARRQGPDAVGALERAAELQPSYAGAYQWLCWAHLLLGHPEEALEAGRHAIRLDPLDPEARGNVAVAYLGCGDPTTALKEARLSLERYPGYDYARWAAGLALWGLGRSEEAAPEFEALSEAWVRNWSITARVLDAPKGGRAAAAQAALERLEGKSAAFHVGLVRGALGETDAAFDAVERAAPLAWDETLFVRYGVHGVMTELRGNRRFPSLVQAVDESWGIADA